MGDFVDYDLDNLIDAENDIECINTKNGGSKMSEEQAEYTNKNLVVVNAKIVMPAVSTTEAVKAWDDYQDLKKNIADENDVQVMNGKLFLKKSYWRKIQRFFNLKLSLMSEERIVKEKVSVKAFNKDGFEMKENIAYSVIYRAEAPNGAFADGDGFCETWEKNRFNVEHNVRATAHTRAKNRAISDLVGGGEVSAEEVSEDIHLDQTEIKSHYDNKIPPAAKPVTGETLTEIINVDSVTKKEGMHEKTKKPWVKFTIYTVPDAAGNKQHFNTFSESLATIAKNSIGKNEASISYTVGQYGNDLKGIELVEEPKKAVEDVGF